jgi:FlaA1/EpsC-like NDP-sugar epimerase
LWHFPLETRGNFCPLYKFIQAKIRQKKLISFVHNKKIILRGANKELEQVLNHKKLKNNSNILGIIDKNPNKIGRKIFNYKISNYDILNTKNPDIIVLSAPTIYNFEKIVVHELQNINKNIQLDTTIFNIQKD